MLVPKSNIQDFFVRSVSFECDYSCNCQNETFRVLAYMLRDNIIFMPKSLCGLFPSLHLCFEAIIAPSNPTPPSQEGWEPQSASGNLMLLITSEILACRSLSQSWQGLMSGDWRATVEMYLLMNNLSFKKSFYNCVITDVDWWTSGWKQGSAVQSLWFNLGH